MYEGRCLGEEVQGRVEILVRMLFPLLDWSSFHSINGLYKKENWNQHHEKTADSSADDQTPGLMG